LEGLRQTKTEIANVQAAQHEFRNDVANQAVGALGGFFNDLIDGAKSFKEAFTDMVRNFLAGVAKMIAQELALRAVQAALRAWGGGSANGNAFDGGGQMAFAQGAAFSQAGMHAFAKGGAFTNRLFSVPTFFAFGKGGQFGVMGEAGPEAVMPLTRGPGGRLGVDARGAGAQAPTKVVVVFGEAELANAMAGAAGEKVVLAHVSNNRDALNGGG
jgi:lambda family phage tail tape measure protein